MSVIDNANDTSQNFGYFGLPVNISVLIIFVLLAHSFRKFISFTDNMAMTIFGAPGITMADAGMKISEGIKGAAGLDAKTQNSLESDELNAADKEGGEER